MREPGSILLISCYELGHQPLGVGWACAFLRRAGFSPHTLDIAIEPLDKTRILRAGLIGISVPMHTALRLGVQVAGLVRQLNPACHICFFGLYAQLNRDYLLSSVADSVIGGEYEQALVSLAEALESNGLDELKGVSRAGRLQDPVLVRLALPVPDRSGLPDLNRYAKLEHNGVRSLAGYVEATRGCKHHCLHCPIPPVYGGRFFVIPKEVVLQDIRGLVAAGARHITFGDPDFLNGPGHSLTIVRTMHREFPELTFDFTAKIEHLLKCRESFPELAEAGCLFVVSAVESLSDEVLGHLHKGHTRQDVYEALGILRRAGIALRPSWVAFTPWTTLNDYLAMLQFVEQEALVYHVDPVQYTIRLLIPPGSGLLSQVAIRPFLRELDQTNFYYRWEHPDPRMDRLHEQVSRTVEEATTDGQDSGLTFVKIKQLALRAAGNTADAVYAIAPQPNGSHVPRLTEAWFCCAEPTNRQLTPVV